MTDAHIKPLILPHYIGLVLVLQVGFLDWSVIPDGWFKLPIRLRLIPSTMSMSPNIFSLRIPTQQFGRNPYGFACTWPLCPVPVNVFGISWMMDIWHWLIVVIWFDSVWASSCACLVLSGPDNLQRTHVSTWIIMTHASTLNALVFKLSCCVCPPHRLVALRSALPGYWTILRSDNSHHSANGFFWTFRLMFQIMHQINQFPVTDTTVVIVNRWTGCDDTTLWVWIFCSDNLQMFFRMDGSVLRSHQICYPRAISFSVRLITSFKIN